MNIIKGTILQYNGFDFDFVFLGAPNLKFKTTQHMGNCST